MKISPTPQPPGKALLLCCRSVCSRNLQMSARGLSLSEELRPQGVPFPGRQYGGWVRQGYERAIVLAPYGMTRINSTLFRAPGLARALQNLCPVLLPPLSAHRSWCLIKFLHPKLHLSICFWKSNLQWPSFDYTGYFSYIAPPSLHYSVMIYVLLS